jgi:hypothetical protein
VNSNPNKQKQTGYKQYDLLQKISFNTGHVANVLNFQYSTTSDIYRYDRSDRNNRCWGSKICAMVLWSSKKNIAFLASEIAQNQRL